MTKKNYMALDDVQSLWTNDIKPWINDQIETLDEKMEGPYYDDEHEGIIYPDYVNAQYNPQTGGIYL